MSNNKEINVENENDNGDVESSYQPPPQKTIEEIVAADQEDESLRKYKEALLGAAQSETIIVGKWNVWICEKLMIRRCIWVGHWMMMTLKFY